LQIKHIEFIRKLEGKSHLGDLNIYGRVILEWDGYKYLRAWANKMLRIEK